MGEGSRIGSAFGTALSLNSPVGFSAQIPPGQGNGQYDGPKKNGKKSGLIFVKRLYSKALNHAAEGYFLGPSVESAVGIVQKQLTVGQPAD